MNDAAEPDTGERDTGRPRRRRSAVWRVLGVAITALALLLGAAVPAAAAELMRVTFVRHGQSAGNASGLIDTTTPGPVITELGQQQARTVAGTLGDNNYDSIYASTMVRTQLTAAPMSQYLRLPIQVLPGLQEIEAGVFEGTPESQAADGYGLFPLAWAIQGNRDLRIPGSIDGNEFDARMDGALKTIWDKGDRNSVIFSHGGAIMFWTMMNAVNLTAAQKIDLLRTAPLSNTNYVIVEGNPEDGWTLVNWNGRLFSPEPTFGAEVRRQLRTLNRQLATSVAQFVESFASRDFATIATAFNRSVADAVYSIAKYHRAIHAKVIHDLDKIFRPTAEAPTEVSTVVAAPEAATDTATTEATTTAVSTIEDTDTTTATTRTMSSKPDVADAEPTVQSLTDDAAPTEKPLADDESPVDMADRDSDEDAPTDLADEVRDADEESSDKRDDSSEEKSADGDTADDKSPDRSDSADAGGDSDSGSERDAA